jgi:hypothetical protein
MAGNLGTTNLLLGIMAFASLIEALVVVGIGVAGLMIYRRVMHLVSGIETRQIAPAMIRVNAILDDVRDVTATVRDETERVDQAIRTTMDRMDDAAERVRSNVQAKTNRVVGFLRALRTAIEVMLRNREQTAAGRR